MPETRPATAQNDRNAHGRGRRDAALELCALVAVYVAYLAGRLFLRLHIIFISAVAVATIGYLCWRARRGGRTLLRFWGLRLDNVKTCAAIVGPPTVAVAIAILIHWWLAVSASRPPLSFFLLLPLYPPWGMVQQFLFQSLFHRDLQILTRQRLVPCLLTAVAFGLLHVNAPALAVATFLGGLFWSAVFIYCPNIYVLGTSHGLLGAMFFYLVTGDDILRAVF